MEGASKAEPSTSARLPACACAERALFSAALIFLLRRTVYGKRLYAIGNNESPAFSPNGRHVAFVSSRAGREQVFTIHRDGSVTPIGLPGVTIDLNTLWDA